MKGSIEPSGLDARQFTGYGRLCASLLARAHAQSPAAAAVAGYLGKSPAFAEATATRTAAYADVAEADFEALATAVRRGRFPVEHGV